MFTWQEFLFGLSLTAGLTVYSCAVNYAHKLWVILPVALMITIPMWVGAFLLTQWGTKRQWI